MSDETLWFVVRRDKPNEAGEHYEALYITQMVEEIEAGGLAPFDKIVSLVMTEDEAMAEAALRIERDQRFRASVKIN